MQRSFCNTIALPATVSDVASGDAVNPGVIHKASQVPLRVLVQNNSLMGMAVNISYDNASLQPGTLNPQNGFILSAGMSQIFPLMPDETLYGTSPNLFDGLVSYIVSEAFPFEVKPGR